MLIKICSHSGICKVSEGREETLQNDFYLNLHIVFKIDVEQNSICFSYLCGEKNKEIKLLFDNTATEEYNNILTTIDYQTVTTAIDGNATTLQPTMTFSKDELARQDLDQDLETAKLRTLSIDKEEQEYIDENLGQVEGKSFLKKIGEGGMSIVYLARNEEEQLCVIKFLTKITKDPAPLKRFAQEVRVSLLLDHPNIAKVLGFNQTSKGIWYLSMEYIWGLSLSQIIEKRRKISCREALQIALDTAKALQYAWNKKIIHRDLKPENILVEKKGFVVKIIDFGIAKIVGESNLTKENQIFGTLHYMSPEQMLASKNVDYRGDIYSLGANLYHMLSGKPPYWDVGENILDIVTAISSGNLTPINKVIEGIPSFVIAVVEKAMHHNIEKRYQSYAELIKELRQAIKQLTID